MQWSLTKQEKFLRGIGTYIIGKENHQSRSWLVKACDDMAEFYNDWEVTNSRVGQIDISQSLYFPI